MTKISIETHDHEVAKLFRLLIALVRGEERDEHHHHDHQYRLVPVLSLIREQKGPVPAPNVIGPYHKSELLLMFKMSDSQQTVASFKVQMTDKKGNPVSTPPPPGTFQFGTDSPSLISLVQGTLAADGTTFTADPAGVSCQVTAVGPLGTASFSAKYVDAVGATIAAGTDTVEIDAGAAANATIGITFAPPTEQP